MKKILLLASLLLLVQSASAFATGIGGHVGLTLRGGLAVPADQSAGAGVKLDSNIGYAYGGGLMYGINNNLAAEMEVVHSTFNADLSGARAAKFNSNDISIGGQYRFIGTAPMLQKVVPYLGAGVDIILPEAKFEATGKSSDIDLAVGGSLKAGSDLFITSNFALNLEIKGVLATESNIRDGGVIVGKFDPSTVLVLMGARVIF